LIAQVPDVTRLLDRMEDAGLVVRERDVKDRRFVTTTITPEGMRVLAELDEPMRELHREHLGHMSEADLRTLIDLLARARSGVQRTVGDGTTRTGEST
jgi:DNA-binding MarR family transcriptional regulator